MPTAFRTPSLATVALTATAALLASVTASRAAPGTVTVTFDAFPGPDGQLGTADDVRTEPQLEPLSREYDSVGLRFDGGLREGNWIVGESIDRPDNHVLFGLVNPQLYGSYTAIAGGFATPVRTLTMNIVIDYDDASLLVRDVNDRPVITERVQGTTNLVTATSDVGIRGFSVSAQYDNSYSPVYIDDLTFTFVPEPAAAATLALAGLATLARRRRR